MFLDQKGRCGFETTLPRQVREHDELNTVELSCSALSPL